MNVVNDEPQKNNASHARLYHYQKISDAFNREPQLFIDNLLHFESPRRFNDPFDARPHMIFSRGGNVSLDWGMQMIKRMFPTMSRPQRWEEARKLVKKMQDPKANAEVRRKLPRSLQAHFDSTTIKCFSETQTNILQWSYYGGGHKGYCVGFEFPRLWPYKRRSGKDGSIAILKVIYAEEYPVIDIDSDLEAIVNKEVLMASLLTKAKSWSHEQEWRALRLETDRGLQAIEPQAIKSVTFGALMEPAHKSFLMGLLGTRTFPVEMYECKLAEGRYELELVPIVYDRNT